MRPEWAFRFMYRLYKTSVPEYWWRWAMSSKLRPSR